MRRPWSGSSGGPTSSTAPTSSFLRRPRAAAVASVHDLTPLRYPELCDQATLAYPRLISRAVRRGTWIHTDSAFVAAEVVEAFGADPTRIRVVNPGVPELPSVDATEVAATLGRILPPGTGRLCLSVGTAEPRKDLPGLVRRSAQWPIVTPTSHSSWPVRRVGVKTR